MACSAPSNCTVSTEPPPPAESQADRLAKAIEALLFAAGRIVSIEELAIVLEQEQEPVRAAVDRLEQQLTSRGVQLLRVAGGLRIVTRPEHGDAVRRLLQPEPARMTPARLETLAVIAYRQPVTRAEIDAIRGVDCGATVKLLVDLGLVELRGRRHDRPGRPLLYGTTPRFLVEFGLDRIEDLPQLGELEA